MKNETKTFYIPCSCRDVWHVLQFIVYRDYFHDKLDKDIGVQTIIPKLSLKKKIKAIWCILTGKEYVLGDSHWMDNEINKMREVIEYYDREDIQVHDDGEGRES